MGRGGALFLAAMLRRAVIRGPLGNNNCRVYVGNLPPDIESKELECVFHRFGYIRDVDLKNRHGGQPFAFVEFDSPR